MNFISKLLLPKVAGTIGALMLAAIMVLSVSVYTKSQRIESLTVQIESCEAANALAFANAANLSDSNVQKDEIIRRQSVSIKSLKEKSDAERLAYRVRLQESMGVASALRRDAEEILRLEAGTTDELGLCRAARDLLEKELIND
jgi:hypothetical protein